MNDHVNDVAAYLDSLPVEKLKEVSERARDLAKAKKGQLDATNVARLDEFIASVGGYDKAKRYWAAVRKRYAPPAPRKPRAPAQTPDPKASAQAPKKATNGKGTRPTA